MSNPIFSKVDIIFSDGVSVLFTNIISCELSELHRLFKIKYKQLDEEIIMYVPCESISRLKAFVKGET